MGSEFVRRKSSVWAKKSDTKPSMFAPRPFVVNKKPLFPPRPSDAPVHYQEDTVSKKELPLEIPPANYITAKMGYPAPQPTVQRQEENLEEKEPEQEAEVNLKSDAPPTDEESKIDLKADAGSTPPYYIFPKLNFGASQPAIQRQEALENEQEEDSQLDLKSDEAIQAKCSDCESEAQQKGESVQTKLTVGEPGDKYEQEADTVAAKVVEHINSPQTEQPVQGKVEPVVKPTLMRQGGAGAGTVNQDVEQNIQQARGGGQGLADNVRQPMEQAFGADFSGVKVHTDGQADTLNRSLNSRAFATGQDIFFKQGEYNPGSKQGQELLAHELTHVVQQGDVGSQIQRYGIDESFDTLANPLETSSMQAEKRRQAVQSLASWCRSHIPNQTLLQQYLHSPSQKELDLMSRLEKIEQLATTSQEESHMSENSASARRIQQQFLVARRSSLQAKTQTIGQLAVEIARMEFLLGWMHEGGVQDPDSRGWENDGENQGDFPDFYKEKMQTHDSNGKAPWCTSFAGYAYNQLAFQFNDEDSPRGRSMFWSGSRLRRWMLEGKVGSGKRKQQVTPDTETVLSEATSGSIIDKSAWKQLWKNLRKCATDEKRKNAVKAFFESYPQPQAGDFLIIGRDNDFTPGAHSHTTLVESYNPDTSVISTIEGNQDSVSAVGARQINLSDENDVRKIVFIGRLGAEYFMDKNFSQSDNSATSGQQESKGSTQTVTAEEVLHSVQLVNERLAIISSAQRWIMDSSPQASAYNWLNGSAVSNDSNSP